MSRTELVCKSKNYSYVKLSHSIQCDKLQKNASIDDLHTNLFLWFMYEAQVKILIPYII